MLNFNVEPYYDDFDPSKNFHRILFKPGSAVQARELTQSQTILQNQISNFANHIFSQNTPVTGGQVTINQNCYYLKLNRQYNNTNIVAANWLNKIITNVTGKVLAKVIKTAEATGTDVEAGDPPTLIITYLSGVQFGDADTIYAVDGTNIFATIIGTAGGTTGVGLSSVASISDGVFYVVNGYSESSIPNEDGTFTKYSVGNFVAVQPQTVILSKYSNTPSARIGLSIGEQIIDYVDDSSLLDPAVGASNYQAPGADRYQIVLTLSTLPLALGNDDQFIELVRIDDGNIEKQVDNTVYSTIDDYFAKRTAETNGDYVVSNFKITPSANTLNANTYVLGVGPGIAYVQGYRVENQSTFEIESNRARTTRTVNNNANYIDYGNFVYVDTVKGLNGGFFDITTGANVDFHIVGPTDIERANSAAYNKTLAATAKIRSLTYTQASNTSNSQTYVYKAHLFDISSKTITSNVASANTTYTTLYTNNGKFSNVANAYVGTTITIDSGTSVGDTRTITYYNPINGTIQTDAPFTITPDATSQISIRFGVKDFDSMVYANSTFDLLGTSSLSTYGKVGGSPTGYTQLYSTTNTQLLFPLGNQYVAGVTDSSYTTTQEFRAQAFGSFSTGSRRYLQLDPSATGTFDLIKTASGSNPEPVDAVLQNWVVINNNTGELLDFTKAGRSIVVDTDKNGVYLTALDLSPFTATIYTKLTVTDGNDTNLVLKSKTLVTANTTVASSAGPDGIVNNTYIDTTNGQIWIPTAGVVDFGTNQSLYVSDVKRIVKIVDTNNVTPNVALLSTAADITSYYDFFDGQTDNYYGHSYIKLKAGRTKPKSLWILFDHYEHSGGDGYFSAQSYSNVGFSERPTYRATNGNVYSLKDCLDFRPAVLNGQSSFVFKYKITPTTTNNSGFFLPGHITQFTSDYSFYLGRRDILFVNKNQSIELIEGEPDINPLLPSQPEGSLLLANITLDPYTEYVPGEVIGKPSNVNIQPVQHKRWSFKDITDLQNRVNNLEYYSSLNLLEQKATTLQIPDVNGLNRFKNGIVVDDFSTFGVADSYNNDFSAAINTRFQYMTPAILVNKYTLQNQQLLSVNNQSLSNTAISSLTYKATNNNISPVFMLKYTEETLASQPLASRFIPVNPFGVVNSTGVLSINPPIDNWIDNTATPDLLFVDPNIRLFNPSSTLNLLEGNPTLNFADWQTIPGSEKTLPTFEENGFNVTQTTATKQNKYTYGYWSETYSFEGDFIKNVALLPYIRSQQITFRATDLLFNTTVNAWFDGKRVSRLIRKSNILELTSVSGSFKVGDVIGYISSSIFYRTGVVSDVYRYANGNIRLYVVEDQTTTTYGSTVVNAFFNTSNVYQNSTASGTLSSSTHYSGRPTTNTTNTNTVALSTLANSTDIYSGSEFWIVSGSATSILSIPKGQSANIVSYNTSTKTVTLDRNVIINTSDTYSIGSLQTNEIGNISGIFNLPGGTFNTGTRIFRLDNRQVTKGISDFYYLNGTETTYAEATFFAQGLTTQSQKINFAATADGQKNTVTTIQQQTGVIRETRSEVPRGGGGCCVIATALTDKGIWQQEQKDTLVEWCEKYLHNKTLGECFRRGYQVMGSKLLVPALRADWKWLNNYANWSWTNGTNMVMGKKFNPLSIPNSLIWITIWMGLGAVVTKKFATKCWTSLYK